MIFLFTFFPSCIDPVVPEYNLKEGLTFIEGFASTAEGASFVRLGKTDNQYGLNRTIFQQNAVVYFFNEDTGDKVQLSETDDAYVPSANFKVNIGENWSLDITMEDGTHYKSFPEKVLNPVPIANLTSAYNPELRFNREKGSFEPGHTVSVTFDDPIDSKNYYYWTYRSFESQTICDVCYDGILRDEKCQSAMLLPPYYFTYFCDTDCWKIRYPSDINIFEDKFTNGKTIKNLQIAELLLYNKRDILVEVQQFSLTPSAYEYYKILDDIIDNSSGLNAPPPAALIGNIFNANNQEDYIFGRFTASATAVSSLLIKRNNITESQLEPDLEPNLEPQLNSPYPPPITISTPCSESRFRTGIKPNGWPE